MHPTDWKTFPSDILRTFPSRWNWRTNLERTLGTRSGLSRQPHDQLDMANKRHCRRLKKIVRAGTRPENWKFPRSMRNDQEVP